MYTFREPQMGKSDRDRIYNWIVLIVLLESYEITKISTPNIGLHIQDKKPLLLAMIRKFFP